MALKLDLLYKLTNLCGSPVVGFRTTSGLDTAIDPSQVKNVTFEHVKGVSSTVSFLLTICLPNQD